MPDTLPTALPALPDSGVEPHYDKVWKMTKRALQMLMTKQRSYDLAMNIDRTNEQRKSLVDASLQGKVVTALRAAIAPHKVIEYSVSPDQGMCEICQTCGTEWPCETVSGVINVLEGKSHVHAQ